jgi:hypothetical protein
VTRIHNRFLRNKFEERLENLIDLTNERYKRGLEYLFYGGDPNMSKSIFRAIEYGLQPTLINPDSTVKCVPLVNNVFHADFSRI